MNTAKHSEVPLTNTEKTETDLLKAVLENMYYPERLDRHPWAARPFVKDSVEREPNLRRERPGRQLAAALQELFCMTMPSTPPRRGKRLDTRWGEFGLLAALYFAPAQFGAPIPTSLRDAWGRIDQSILLYVNGHEQAENGWGLDRQLERYGLVNPEPEVAPISTLSDWHRKGIQRLAESIEARERFLEKLPAPEPATSPVTGRLRPFRKALLLASVLLLLALLGLGGYKARQIYRLGMVLRADLSELRGAAASAAQLDIAAMTKAQALLSTSRRDFAAFQKEVEPFLWLGPQLGWVPVYGGDLAASPELLGMADLLLESADRALGASQPFAALLEDESSPRPPQLVASLNQVQPQLNEAHATLAQALELRTRLDAASLSPLTASYLADVDRLLPLMDDGLTLGTSLPHLLGATSDGPKTYLLLVQNEDELRPTGGFITAVGTLVVQNGEVLSLEFVDSGELDNWEKPYPQAPWQLEQYMNSPVLVLRDANWFPDFPTSALYAESLYAYNYSHSVDGVIAFDQHMLVLMLEALGPLEVEGAPYPIEAGNVIAYMRSAKSGPQDPATAEEWTRKGFMDKITRAMLLKIFEGSDVSWQALGAALLRGQEQRHLLLQLDDPALADLMARRGWDGTLRYPGGDFLTVVDANIGFNKTNAVVDTTLSYDVDLTDPAQPAGTLTVTHTNNASPDVPCMHWGGQRLAGQEAYPIDACYWSYMRVYVPAGAQLLDATPQSVPGGWMMLDRGVQAPVDLLNEKLDGLQGFGALLVVPGGKSHLASFEWRLSAGALQRDGDRLQYDLTVRKQPGTIAVPLLIRIHLPNGTSLESASLQPFVEGNNLYFETDLSTDLQLHVDLLLK